MATHQPTLRWGIIATGMVSSWFVRDISRQRPDARATHVIQAIGSSSVAKGEAFVQEFIPEQPRPRVYGSYAEVYADPDVDIVYIGTPHGFHRQNCLDAIAAGKHVLCEKAFALSGRDAREVLEAARARGVFVLEALRLRFFPLTRALLRLVHEEHVIGDVHRVFCDLGLDMDVAGQPADSRLRNPALGAGTLLDIGIYSITWGRLFLGGDPEASKTETETNETRETRTKEKPRLLAIQSLLPDGVDVATSMLLHYPATGGHGLLTSTSFSRTPHVFCRVEGTRGYITVEGESASIPSAFTVYPKVGDDPSAAQTGTRHEYAVPGYGLYWEADAAAVDIAAGRTEDPLMPWQETLDVLDMMDEARRQGGSPIP